MDGYQKAELCDYILRKWWVEGENNDEYRNFEIEINNNEMYTEMQEMEEYEAKMKQKYCECRIKVG